MKMRDIIVFLGDRLQGDDLQGAIAVLNQFGKGKLSRPGALGGGSLAGAVQWIQHADFVCIPIGNAPVTVRSRPQTGSWKLINAAGSGQANHRIRFSADSGTRPQSRRPKQRLRAQLLPDARRRRAVLAAHPTWEILRNDAGVQVARWADGTVMTAFYRADSLDVKGVKWKVSRPCLLLWSAGALRASDPTQKGGDAGVSVGDKTVKIALPAGGTISAPINVVAG